MSLDRLRGLHVLVVEDEEDVLRFLIEALGEAGSVVQTASDLRTGTRLFSSFRFDIVMVDKNLPDGNGLALARAIAEVGGPTQVMIMSGYANLASAVEAIRHGVADYLIKPFDLDDLLARMERVAELHALHRDNAELIAELKRQNDNLAGLVCRDPLTRLYNHAHFQESLEREIVRSRRNGLELAVALVDPGRSRRQHD